ncbi:hypothetical protein O181_014300 [Austropuccinia psidii MF-1]|uniref:Uncharacterized protein n=1 Tax=Austropuccinia psidii MF-1 TaxID=1389203 RepID=A0A9Q3C1L7_9BASI|nr:hypothetical protein [Austropuccinia psidii MF-1]
MVATQWSIDHGTWSVGPLGPFQPKSNEAKRNQGGSTPAPKVRWAHLSQFLPQSQQSQKWPRTTFWLLSTSVLWKTLEATSSGPARFPSIQGKNSSSPMYSVPKDPGMVHIWYNIPLENSMVMLSGEKYAFSI